MIGGGDVAVEDAIFLSRMCSKVYLIHRRGKLRAAKSLQNQLFSKGNVEILWNTEAEAIKGDGAVESLLLQDHVTGEKKEISLQGVFIAVGIQPETAALKALWIWNRVISKQEKRELLLYLVFMQQAM